MLETFQAILAVKEETVAMDIHRWVVKPAQSLTATVLYVNKLSGTAASGNSSGSVGCGTFSCTDVYIAGMDALGESVKQTVVVHTKITSPDVC